MGIGERIRQLREDHDLNQTQIANILGLDQSYYAKYENERHQIPAHVIKKICEYYQVSADYILGLPKDLKWPR